MSVGINDLLKQVKEKLERKDQKRIAEKTGLHWGVVSRYLSGKHKVNSHDTALKIIAAGNEIINVRAEELKKLTEKQQTQ